MWKKDVQMARNSLNSKILSLPWRISHWMDDYLGDVHTSHHHHVYLLNNNYK